MLLELEDSQLLLVDYQSRLMPALHEGDKALASFSIDHDRQARLPMIKQAIAAAAGELPLFASPWSAPAFMKTTGNMLRGGALLPEYRQAWANYFVRFIQAYENEGVPIWGITVQNEPMATQTWESMLYTAEEERDFLKDYLGPTMHAAGYADKKIIVWDHNRDMMLYRAQVILGDPEAAKYAWGLGFHWYETWAGFDPMFRNVAAVTEAFPDKPVLLTEAAVEKFDPARYQHWPNAERYGTSMIHDLNNGAVGWTDWNMLLDEKGSKIRLTEKETSILKYLYRAGEKVVTRDILLQEVWGYNYGVTTHTLETHIYRLRQKIEPDPANARLLLTESGGYRLQA